MKLRLLESIGGMTLGHWDLKRGQIIDVDENQGKRMISNSIATALRANMTCPVEELPPPGEVTQESQALADWARQETLRGIPAEIRHRVAGTEEYQPEQPVRGYRRSAKAMTGGWIS